MKPKQDRNGKEVPSDISVKFDKAFHKWINTDIGQNAYSDDIALWGAKWTLTYLAKSEGDDSFREMTRKLGTL